MRKITAISPANIAFVKYWGQKDSLLNIPFNNSISMNLSNCTTKTTVEFSKNYKTDIVQLLHKNKSTQNFTSKRITAHLDRIRKLKGIKLGAKVVTYNSFPSDAGIASSASGFSALSLAGTAALELKLSKKELSSLARLGSGSASRSIPDGFVEWKKGSDNNNSYARSIYPINWWNLVDIVVVVSKEKKKHSSLSGHSLATTSSYFRKRQQLLGKRLKKVKSALKNKNIKLLGETAEEEAIDLQVIAMTSKTPVFYWKGLSIDIIRKIREWRIEGLIGYFTFDAGPNPHIICEKKHEKKLNRRLKNVNGVIETIVNYPSVGTRLTDKHLF